MLALTMGEPAGIGAEIAVKAWHALRATGPEFLLIDDADRLVGAPIQRIAHASEARFAEALPVLHRPLPVAAIPGQPQAATAAAVLGAIREAVALALGGALDGVRVIGPETLARFTELQWEGGTWMRLDAAPPEEPEPVDPEMYRRMGLGWLLDSAPGRPQGFSGQGYGHSGAGGAQAFADPAHRLGFCYAPNRMHGGVDIGPRARRVMEALRQCL